MAASGYTPIILLNSTTTGNTPTTSNLAVGELAINVTDGKLFFNQSGTIKVLANATYATSVSTISFGTTGLTPSTATNGVVTVAGTLATTNGGTGLTSFTANGVVYASSTSALATGSALQFDGTNLGLGVTPSAWVGINGLQVGSFGAVSSSSTAGTVLSYNAYATSAGWAAKYQANGFASIYEQVSGAHQWYNAPSGTAGNAISFTQAMTLDASGNLLVGSTSGSGGIGERVAITGGGLVTQATAGATRSMFGNFGTSDLIVGSFDNFTMEFRTNNTERARIDTNGNLLIGYTSSNGSYKLQVNSQIFATSAIIATSDARYKTNVTPISNGLSLVNKLNPVSFDWKEHSVHDFDTKNTNVGFLAQDVQEVLKDEIYLNSVIRKNQTELPDGNKEEFLGLSDSSLIPILVKAIQELTTRLTALENK